MSIKSGPLAVAKKLWTDEAIRFIKNYDIEEKPTEEKKAEFIKLVREKFGIKANDHGIWQITRQLKGWARKKVQGTPARRIKYREASGPGSRTINSSD